MTTQEQKELDDKVMISQWCGPLEKFNSQYGFITFREWCEHEQKRFAAAGKKTEIVERNCSIGLKKAGWV